MIATQLAHEHAMKPRMDDAARDIDNMTTESERASFKRAALHWLEKHLEYAPREQLHDVAAAMNSWRPANRCS